jgi:hypothetical protein
MGGFMQQFAKQAQANKEKRQISINAARSKTASSIVNISCMGAPCQSGKNMIKNLRQKTSRRHE